MFLSTLVVYDSDFETKGKKIRVKDDTETQHPQSNVCLVIRFLYQKRKSNEEKKTYQQLIPSSPPLEWVPV